MSLQSAEEGFVMATRILGPTGSKRRHRFLYVPFLVAALAILGALVTGGSVLAAPSTDASVSEYSQCANGKPPATTTACPQNWINGILNANNSGYHEDDTTAQRLFLDLPRNGPTTGRKIFIRYLARKGQGGGGNHAYDFASVTVTYSVTSTPAKVELIFGGHLAPAVGSRGWGTGVGASFINGGPYHIKLDGVDNSSVGNRDNQITAGAILPIGTEVQT